MAKESKNFLNPADAERDRLRRLFVNKPLNERTAEDDALEAKLAGRHGHSRRSSAMKAERNRLKRQVTETRLTEIRRNSQNIKGLAINVRTWAETDCRTFLCWGDWWVKKRLEAAFTAMGHTVEVFPEFADITVYLFGHPFPRRDKYPFFYNPNSFNVCWFHSHPQKMTAEEMAKYNLVFSLSPSFIPQIKDMGPPVEALEVCTDMRPPKKKPPFSHGVVFVGNARGALGFGREIIRDLHPVGYTPVVIGCKWLAKPGFDRAWYAGQYWPYERLPDLYNSAAISLNDHHKPMALEGFLSFRILDVLASGGFCISDRAKGLDRFMDGTVPMFRNAEQLNRLVHRYLADDKARAELSARGMEIAHRHTYRARAEKIVEVATHMMGV